MSQNPDSTPTPEPENGRGRAGSGPRDAGGPTPKDRPGSATGQQRKHGSRTGALWVSTTASIVLLILLIIFILQNSGRVSIVFFTFEGSVPLGMALLIAAVAGAAVVAIAGIARLAQIRINARRARKQKN